VNTLIRLTALSTTSSKENKSAPCPNTATSQLSLYVKYEILSLVKLIYETPPQRRLPDRLKTVVEKGVLQNAVPILEYGQI
jgi:hypothetical protein